MKPTLRWYLYECKERKIVTLSKGFKSKKLAEQARLKFPERERGKIGIGRSL